MSVDTVKRWHAVLMKVSVCMEFTPLNLSNPLTIYHSKKEQISRYPNLILTSYATTILISRLNDQGVYFQSFKFISRNYYRFLSKYKVFLFTFIKEMYYVPA